MAKQYWAACQTMPGREHVVRSEIEKIDRGAFLPTFARTWVSEGKVSARETALIPGYVFFRTDAEGWGVVAGIEGVQGVLTYDSSDEKRIAKPVAHGDMARLVLGHATGAHNSIGAWLVPQRKERGSSRKPRPSKRIRVRTNTDQ
jgi:transcriptional antiterminator NusG